MKFIKWVVKKMDAVKNAKKVNKLPFFAKTLIKTDRPVSVQKTSILACKDFTRTVKSKNEKQAKK